MRNFLYVLISIAYNDHVGRLFVCQRIIQGEFRIRIYYREVMDMKMLFVIYSRETDTEVVAAFKRSGMSGYTKMEEVRGEGQETEPRLGTHIWPGMNNVLIVVTEDDEAATAMNLVRQLKKEHPRAGLKGFLLPLEDCI